MARDCFFVIRCTAEERDAIHALAKAQGVSASDFVRRLALADRPAPEQPPANPSSLRSDQD